MSMMACGAVWCVAGENPITKFYNPVAVTDSSFDIEVKLYPEGKVNQKQQRCVQPCILTACC